MNICGKDVSVFLSEPVSMRLVLASMAILGGIALVILEKQHINRTQRAVGTPFEISFYTLMTFAIPALAGAKVSPQLNMEDERILPGENTSS